MRTYTKEEKQAVIDRVISGEPVCAVYAKHFLCSPLWNAPPSGPLFYRLAVIYDRGGVKEQHVGDPGKINELRKGRGRDIADIDERYLGISCCKKRGYTAAERITKNDESAFTHDVWVCDCDDRTRTAEKHLVWIASACRIEVVNRYLGRCLGIIYLQAAYHGVVKIPKRLRCVRKRRLTVVDAVKRDAGVVRLAFPYPLRTHFVRNFVSNLQYSFLTPVRIGVIEIIR